MCLYLQLTHWSLTIAAFRSIELPWGGKLRLLETLDFSMIRGSVGAGQIGGLPWNQEGVLLLSLQTKSVVQE